ncbi:MAG TPA: RNA polymerase sigma factor [Kofleriaceae bacterium]|nr:RNA polymerase sigma factor [Kofleriaceae bacterium]
MAAGQRDEATTSSTSNRAVGQHSARAGGQLVPLRRLDERRAALSDISDEALLAACSVSDSAALGALFDRHHEAIYRFISRLLRTDPDEIDDLVQTTFLEAWRSASRYGARGAVKSFLFGIAANTVRHHLRSRQRRHDAISEWQPPPARSGPDDALERARQVQRLAAALDALPHDLRVAYVLCDLEDVAGTDAARILGIRPGTLWRRLHDARRALRASIEGATR